MYEEIRGTYWFWGERRTKGRWEHNIKIDIQEVGLVVWNGLIWLRIGTGGGLLQTQCRNFGFYKLRGIS
jgi:hypothetical protein